MKAKPASNSTRSSGPLLRVRQRHPFRLQSRHVAHRIESRHFDLSGVDDVNNVFDGDRRFSDVRRQNDFASADRRRVEDGSLFGHVDQRMEEVNVGVADQIDVVIAGCLNKKKLLISSITSYRDNTFF